MHKILIVGLGGALGASARFYLSDYFKLETSLFPWVTFFINMMGSLIVGYSMGKLLEIDPTSHLYKFWQLFITVGFAGGFTTFSSFCSEAISLIRTGHSGLAGAYLAASLCCGLMAAYLGFTLSTYKTNVSLPSSSSRSFGRACSDKFKRATCQPLKDQAKGDM